MTVAEWRARASRGVPDGGPFHLAIGLERHRAILARKALQRTGPEEVAAWLCENLRAVAEDDRGQPHSECVLTRT